MDAPLPPPLPPHEDEDDAVRRERGLWPWATGALLVSLVLLVVQCHRCTALVVEDVDGFMEELSKYNTEPGGRWDELPVHAADELVASLLADEADTKARHVGEAIVISSRRWSAGPVEPPPGPGQGPARRYGIRLLDADAGRIEAEVWDAGFLADPRPNFVSGIEATEERIHTTELILAGWVDWMNRGTIRLRHATVRIAQSEKPRWD